MFEFLWPWSFLLLPLPLLVIWLPAVANKQGQAMRVPFFSDIEMVFTGTRRVFGWRFGFLYLAWILLVVAATKPAFVGELVNLPASGRDLLVAIDISGSMQETDMELDGQRVDRLTAVKAVAREFIERRHGDRIGLILFGTQAYVQTPLTFDHHTVQQFLSEAEIGLAGEKTAIGDAIGLALKRSGTNGKKDHVLVMLTDGANSAGEVSPRQAAQLASHYGMRIYSIGFGADEMLVRDLFGVRRVNPSADLDEETLQEMATMTAGQYFRARNVNELSEIYRLLDDYEPLPQAGENWRPRQDLFYWPLSAAVLLLFLVLLCRFKPVTNFRGMHHG